MGSRVDKCAEEGERTHTDHEEGHGSGEVLYRFFHPFMVRPGKIKAGSR